MKPFYDTTPTRSVPIPSAWLFTQSDGGLGGWLPSLACRRGMTAPHGTTGVRWNHTPHPITLAQRTQKRQHTVAQRAAGTGREDLSTPHEEPSYHRSTTRLRKRQVPLTTIEQPTRLPQPPNGLAFSWRERAG
jgi:hypothetical protein